MSSDDSFFDDEDERSFFARHRALSAVLGAVLLGGIVWGATRLGKKDEAPRRTQEVTMVKLAPLPPPPPPPPPPPHAPPPPQEQKMIEQEPVNEPEDKPTPDEPPAAPDLGTGIKGDGPPDGFGLGGGRGSGGLGGSGNRQRSKWGWYAGQVQGKVQDALRTNRRTRSANLRVEVRLWADSTGRVTRSQLAGTSGDPAIDAALRNEVLAGLQLAEPPPQGMPMPIVLRVTARRPN